MSLRDQFLLDPGVVFLNHGSFGACPRPVLEAQQRWQRELEREPVEFLARRLDGLLEEARAPLAAYLGARPVDLVFVPNATTAMNTVARSLGLGPDDEVLTSDQEYGAVDLMWDATGALVVALPRCVVENRLAMRLSGPAPGAFILFDRAGVDSDPLPARPYTGSVLVS